MTTEVMKQALEALTTLTPSKAPTIYSDAIIALRQAIEQEDSNEQHLMNLLARIHGDGGHYVDEHGVLQAVEVADKLVAQWWAIEQSETVPARVWVGLTAAEITSLMYDCNALPECNPTDNEMTNFAKALESTLKEKNTPK